MLELEDDAPKVKSSLFEKPVIVHEKNQGTIVLEITLQMKPHTKHIGIK